MATLTKQQLLNLREDTIYANASQEINATDHGAFLDNFINSIFQYVDNKVFNLISITGSTEGATLRWHNTLNRWVGNAAVKHLDSGLNVTGDIVHNQTIPNYVRKTITGWSTAATTIYLLLVPSASNAQRVVGRIVGSRVLGSNNFGSLTINISMGRGNGGANDINIDYKSIGMQSNHTISIVTVDHSSVNYYALKVVTSNRFDQLDNVYFDGYASDDVVLNAVSSGISNEQAYVASNDNKLHYFNSPVIIPNATENTHAINRQTGDGRYGRLGAANEWTSTNTFENLVSIDGFTNTVDRLRFRSPSTESVLTVRYETDFGGVAFKGWRLRGGATNNVESSNLAISRADNTSEVTYIGSLGIAVGAVAQPGNGRLITQNQIEVGTDFMPVQNYFSNIGAINKKFLTAHIAELMVETLVAQEIMSTVGGRIVVAPTTELTRDLNNSSTTIFTKHDNLTSGDVVLLLTIGKVEFIYIEEGASNPGGGATDFEYNNCIRNLDGSGANEWDAGSGIMNTRKAGDGFIDMYATGGIKSGIGPTIVGNVRNSDTYNDWSEHWAIGNLRNIYGYTSDIYGAAFGAYKNSSSFVTIDNVDGFRIVHKGAGGAESVKVQVNMAGNAYLAGEIEADSGVIGGWTITNDMIHKTTGNEKIEIDSINTRIRMEVGTTFQKIINIGTDLIRPYFLTGIPEGFTKELPSFYSLDPTPSGEFNSLSYLSSNWLVIRNEGVFNEFIHGVGTNISYGLIDIGYYDYEEGQTQEYNSVFKVKVTKDIETTGNYKNMTFNISSTGGYGIDLDDENDKFEITKLTKITYDGGATINLTGTHNALNITTSGVIITVNPTSTGRILNGMTQGVQGRHIILYNVNSSFGVTINTESGSASAANRINIGGGLPAVIFLRPGAILRLTYINSRWRTEQTYEP